MFNCSEARTYAAHMHHQHEFSIEYFILVLQNGILKSNIKHLLLCTIRNSLNANEVNNKLTDTRTKCACVCNAIYKRRRPMDGEHCCSRRS